MRNRVILSFLIVALTGVVGCATPPQPAPPGPAPPQPAPPGPGVETGLLVAAYKIGSLPTQWGTDPNPKTKYLSTNPVSLVDGGNVELWDYFSYHSGGTTHKTWFFEPTGVVDRYYLKNVMTGKCLNAEALTNGAAITQRRCEAGSSKQVWKLQSMGQWGYRLRLVSGDRCVESTGFNNGDKVQLWDCLLPPYPNKVNQLWVTEAHSGAPNPPHDSGKGALCDVCDPKNPMCSEPGGKCIVFPAQGQAFCGRQCSQTTPCPQGYDCTKIPGNTFQCVPKSTQCSYEFIGQQP